MRTALLLAFAFPLLAQTPNFRGATITTVRAAGDLKRQIESSGASTERAWVGYTIPLARGRRVEVCCSLDDDNINIRTSEDALSDDAAILYRVADGRILSIRVFSSCAISAHGASITWIEGVDSRASVEMLFAMAKSNGPLSHKAVFALGLHEGGTDDLIDLARHSETSKLRSDALFWLAQSAGEKAAATLREAVDNDPDDEVRAKAVFGISQLPNDQSIPMLAELMRTHRSAAVRKKAAFWLGQKNDPRAVEAITSYLRQ
jgi:hypothetical protein